jgi:hypothetical protein
VHAPKAEMIGDKAFAGCKNLESLTLGETPPELGEDVFARNKAGQLLAPQGIYVPKQAFDTYMNIHTETTNWTDDLKAKVASLP